MKICIISDTHQMHKSIKMPEADIAIHCGDFTSKGDFPSVEKFFNWFEALPYKYKICIAGNHELSLEGSARPKILKLIKSFTDKNKNLFYLENSSVTLEGINFYGSPITPYFGGWAFNRQRGRDIEIEWARIPLNTNVLITHGPPYGILDLVEDDISNMNRDLHQGCKDLSNRISFLKELELHCFGHLHLQGGNTFKEKGITYVNAAICTECYAPTNPPVVYEI